MIDVEQVRRHLLGTVPTEADREILGWVRDRLARLPPLERGDPRCRAAIALLERLAPAPVRDRDRDRAAEGS